MRDNLLNGAGTGPDLRRSCEYAACRLTLAALGRMPRSAALGVGRALGRIAFRVMRRRRHVALANLELVWRRQLSAAERDGIAQRSCAGLGQLLTEFARLPRLTAANVDRLVTWDGWEHYERARAKGRGVLYLAAHFGAWELIPYAQAVRGYPMAFVVRPVDNPRVETLVRAYRERSGNSVIPKRSAVRECLRRVRQGETVGILIDQHVPPDRGVPTQLLGQDTHTTPVLAALALRTGAPVLPVFALREDGDRHRIVLGPEIEVCRTGDRQRDLLETTRRFVAVVEDQVRANPDHWL